MLVEAQLRIDEVIKGNHGMREFRFRGWIRSLQVMTDPFSFGDFDGDYLVSSETFLNDLIVMQSTGQRDAGGVEIWEGDILYSESPSMRLPRRWEVVWQSSGLWIRDGQAYQSIGRLTARVIGNIHAAPELLRQTHRLE